MHAEVRLVHMLSDAAHIYTPTHTQYLRYALDAMLALNWKKHLQHNHHNHFEPQVQYHPIITVEVLKFSNIITQNVDNIGHPCPYCIHGIAWLSRWSPRVWWRCRSRTAGTRDEAEMNPRQFPREAHVPPLYETAQMRSHVEKSDGYPTCNATCNSTFKNNVPHHAIEEPSTRRMRFKLLTLFSRCVCFFKLSNFQASHNISQHPTASLYTPVVSLSLTGAYVWKAAFSVSCKLGIDGKKRMWEQTSIAGRSRIKKQSSKKVQKKAGRPAENTWWHPDDTYFIFISPPVWTKRCPWRLRSPAQHVALLLWSLQRR